MGAGQCNPTIQDLEVEAEIVSKRKQIMAIGGFTEK